MSVQHPYRKFLPFKSKVIITFILFFIFNCAKAQFFGLLQKNPENYYYTCLSYPKDGKLRVFNVRYLVSNFKTKCQILVFSGNLQLIDSVELIANASPFHKEPLKINQSLIWPCVFSDSLSYDPSNPYQQLAVLILDTNYRHNDLKKLGPIVNSILVPTNLVKIYNNYYVGYRDFFLGTSRIYRLDLSFNKVDSILFNGRVFELGTSENQLTISGAYLPGPCIDQYGYRTQKVLLDTAMAIIDCITYDSLTTVQVPDLNFAPHKLGSYLSSVKVIPISDTKFFIAGQYYVSYELFQGSKDAIVNSITDNNNNVLKTSVFSSSLTNYNYVSESNFVSIVGNEIVTVGRINHTSEPRFTQNEPSWIFINKLDTMGNVIWQKKYGGDMYYNPYSIIKTTDGGYLVGGIRYDSSNTLYPNIAESFLLKLDQNGYYDAVSILENPGINKPGIKVFPNPGGKVVYFDIPFEENINLEIFNSIGEKIASLMNYKNLDPVDVGALSNGIYLYRIKTRKYNYSGRFIKN